MTHVSSFINDRFLIIRKRQRHQAIDSNTRFKETIAPFRSATLKPLFINSSLIDLKTISFAQLFCFAESVSERESEKKIFDEVEHNAEESQPVIVQKN